MTALSKVPDATVSSEMSRRDNKFAVKVVSSLDDHQKAMAVRAAVFLGKPGWTYDHTFDANDHCATHLLAEVDGEPAGTVRVRWFSGFARIERIAILPEHRSLALLNALARTAVRLCRKKGYDKVGGLAYPELVNFWRRHGGTPCGELIRSEYGDVIPILLKPKEFPDLAPPLDLADVGTAEFEWKAFAWEGSGV